MAQPSPPRKPPRSPTSTWSTEAELGSCIQLEGVKHVETGGNMWKQVETGGNMWKHVETNLPLTSLTWSDLTVLKIVVQYHLGFAGFRSCKEDWNFSGNEIHRMDQVSEKERAGTCLPS